MGVDRERGKEGDVRGMCRNVKLSDALKTNTLREKIAPRSQSGSDLIRLQASVSLVSVKAADV
jgi:hypothetical protein